MSVDNGRRCGSPFHPLCEPRHTGKRVNGAWPDIGRGEMGGPLWDRLCSHESVKLKQNKTIYMKPIMKVS